MDRGQQMTDFCSKACGTSAGMIKVMGAGPMEATYTLSRHLLFPHVLSPELAAAGVQAKSEIQES